MLEQLNLDLGLAVQIIAIFEGIVCVWFLSTFAIEHFKYDGGVEGIIRFLIMTFWGIMNLQLFKTIGNGKDQLFISILWSLFHVILIFFLQLLSCPRPIPFQGDIRIFTCRDWNPALFAYLIGSTTTVAVYIVRDLI